MKESNWIFKYGSPPQCVNCKVFSRSSEATPYCPYCGSYMINYHKIVCKSWNYGECWGTREREECSCGGDQRKCDFYEDVRRRANGKTL